MSEKTLRFYLIIGGIVNFGFLVPSAQSNLDKSRNSVSLLVR